MAKLKVPPLKNFVALSVAAAVTVSAALYGGYKASAVKTSDASVAGQTQEAAVGGTADTGGNELKINEKTDMLLSQCGLAETKLRPAGADEGRAGEVAEDFGSGTVSWRIHDAGEEQKNAWFAQTAKAAKAVSSDGKLYANAGLTREFEAKPTDPKANTASQSMYYPYGGKTVYINCKTLLGGYFDFTAEIE